MNAPTIPNPVEIDDDDRLNARRRATAAVLYGLVAAMEKEHRDLAGVYYELHLAHGLGKALCELSGDMPRPICVDRLNAELPDLAEEFFQRAEAIMEAAAGAPQS